MRELRPTPPHPVFYGQVHFGTFREPFRTLNLVDADIYGHRWAPRWWRNIRLKEWQHVGIIHDEFYCGFTVFDAKYAGISSCCVYDRRTHQVIDHKRMAISRGAIHVPEQIWRGDGFFRQPGYRVQLCNRLNEGVHRLSIDIEARRRLPPVKAEFVVHEDLKRVQPLIAVLPVNDFRRPMYTHQSACPVEGYLQVGDRSWILSTGQHWALVDEHKTFFPNPAHWKRATFAGVDQDSVRVAVNLAQNMIRDDEAWNECCAWVNGRLMLLGAARFELDPGAIRQPWHLITTDGSAEFTFTPEGECTDQLRVAGLIRSDFHQSFGTYRGFFVDQEGLRHTVDGMFGVAECHALKA